MVYLMCVAHAASQISPTHVCLVVASDYFHVTLGDLVKKTLPASITFILFMTIYYNVLSLILKTHIDMVGELLYNFVQIPVKTWGFRVNAGRTTQNRSIARE